MVRIPFRMDGSLPVVKPSPDLSFISQTIKNAAFEKGKEELKKKVMENVSPKEESTQDVQQKTKEDLEKNVKEKLKKLIPFPAGDSGSNSEQSGEQNSGDQLQQQ